MRYSLAALFLVFVIIISGCVSQPQDKETIKIGLIAPLTGPVPECGDNIKTGVDVALQEMKQKYGDKIELVIEDDRFDPKESVNAIKKMIEADGIKIIIGSCSSSSTLAIAPIAEENKVLLFTPVSFAAKISESGDYIFRAALRSTEGAPVLADFLRTNLSATKAAVIYVNNDYGVSYLNEFKKEFEKLGGQVVLSEAQEPNARDFRASLVKARNSSADVIFIPLLGSQFIPFIQNTKELGIEMPIIATNTLEREEYFSILNSSGDGVFVVTPIDFSHESLEKNQEGRNFFEGLKNYSKTKIPNTERAKSYDVMKILGKIVIEKCGNNSECVKNELYKIRNYTGAGGVFDINENGDFDHKIINVMLIRNGTFVKVN